MPFGAEPRCVPASKPPLTSGSTLEGRQISPTPLNENASVGSYTAQSILCLPVYRILLVLSLVLGGNACTAVNQMVYDDSRTNYVNDNDLTAKDSLHVVQQKVYRGMPVEHALVALGEPDQRDTTSTEDGTRIRYVYVARANAFDPGSKPRGYLYSEGGTVTDWKDLNRIPRLDAYYEGGM